MRKLVRTVRNAFRYGEAGFTLIELLVVIGILAALAGVVTLGVTQFIGRGKTEACETDFHNVQTAVAACLVDHPIGECDAADGAELVTLGYLLDAPLGAYTIDATSGEVTKGTCPK
jgi:prepilin-type N-terminal cleavage/methylation domain-containing protein